MRVAGAIGDMLFNFYDINGRLVEHSLNERSMSIPISLVRRAPIRVLAAGGVEKVDAIIGAFELVRPTAFITDEIAAEALLARAAALGK